jgi:membrane protein required for colicin V production
MQTYDLLMLAVLAAATIFGFWKGLAWQIASLASLVVSYFAALKFADRIAPMVSDQAPWNKYMAMLIVYVGASFAIWMLFRVVAGAIDRVRMNEFDRQMGALVGFAKGVLLCIAITFFAVTILDQQRGQQISSSRSGQYIVQLIGKADAVVPPEIHKTIAPLLAEINRRLSPGYQPNPPQELGQDLSKLWEQAKNSSAGWPTTPSGGAAAWPAPPTSSQPPAAAPPTPAAPISTGGNRR